MNQQNPNTTNLPPKIQARRERYQYLLNYLSPRFYPVGKPKWCVAAADHSVQLKMFEQAVELFVELRTARLPIGGRKASLHLSALRVILPVLENEVGKGERFQLSQSYRVFRRLVAEHDCRRAEAARGDPQMLEGRP